MNASAVFQISQIEIDLGGNKAASCHPDAEKIVAADANENMSPDQILDLISQAKDLGAHTVVLVNGEKFPEAGRAEVADFIKEKGLQVSAFESVTGEKIACDKHLYSCFVKNDGNVYPCAGLPIVLGNIQTQNLSEILSKSEVLENLRDHTFKIKGPCRTCPEFENCCGCRGRTFAETGDYLAADPFCPENHEKADQIIKLPVPVDEFIPQKGAMKLVKTLMDVRERYLKVSAVVPEENPFVGTDGRIEEVAFMEMMAQAAAAMNGFEKYNTRSKNMGGMLIGGQKIVMHEPASAGELLVIQAYKTTRFGNFGILRAEIKREDLLIAEGEIKIYENQESE